MVKATTVTVGGGTGHHPLPGADHLLDTVLHHHAAVEVEMKIRTIDVGRIRDRTAGRDHDRSLAGRGAGHHQGGGTAGIGGVHLVRLPGEEEGVEGEAQAIQVTVATVTEVAAAAGGAMGDARTAHTRYKPITQMHRPSRS